MENKVTGVERQHAWNLKIAKKKKQDFGTATFSRVVILIKE